MPQSQYNYKAVNIQTGKISKGTVRADNSKDLERLLKDSNLELISYKEKKGESHIPLFTGKLNKKDIISIFIHLQQLDKAGINIVDSIADLRDSTNSEKIRDLMQELYDEINSGSMLSQALARRPKMFDVTFIGLIESGERTGKLYESFESIVEHLKWAADIRRKTIKAITFPLFSIFVMFVVLSIMMVLVVPKVTDFVLSQGIALPLMTRALIGFSNIFRHHIIMVFLVPIIIYLSILLLRRFKSMSLIIDEFKTHIPLFGNIIIKIEAARFCHFFAVTFASGIEVLDCLTIAQNVIGNRAVKASIGQIKDQVAAGSSISKAIALSGYFPNLVVRMFKIGEESGNMKEALDNVQYFYDNEINDTIDRIIGTLSPTLTFVMGGLLLWIAVAVFGPLYSTFGQIKL